MDLDSLLELARENDLNDDINPNISIVARHEKEPMNELESDDSKKK